MRALLFIAIVGFAAVSGAAMAQSSSSDAVIPRDKATLCLDGLGINHAPVCHSHSASRMASPPDICLCGGPWRQVDAPYCAKGEKPPADTAAFDRARAKAAEKNSSLFGATYEGKRMCVPLGNEY